MTDLAALIDVAAESCAWEPEPCSARGAWLLTWHGDMMIYCQVHLAIWQDELARRRERDKPKLPGLQDWYERALESVSV